MSLQNKPTLKNGDKVVVVACDNSIPDMQELLGKETEVAGIFCRIGTNEWYILKNSPYAWCLDWLEPVKEAEISITQDNIIDMFGE